MAPVGGPPPYTNPPVPPSTSTSSPTLATPSNGTQPPDGCYWAGPAYPKGGKGKGGKGTTKGDSPKTKKQHSKKAPGKPSYKKIGKGSSQGGKGTTAYVEDVFYEYTDEDSYHYENDYGDWYWCPPGSEHEATAAPSWPAKGKGTSSGKGGSVNHRPMYMHTAAQAQSSTMYYAGDAGVADYYYNANNPADPAPESAGSIQSQSTATTGEGINNNYWAAPPPPPNAGSDATSSTSTSTGGNGGDYYSYTPGSSSSSSHPDSPAYGNTAAGYPSDPYGAATTQGISPPTTTTTTTTNNTSTIETPTAIFVAALAGGSVLALVIAFVVRRKLIHGDEDEDDGCGSKAVVQTQSGDHTVSTIGGSGSDEQVGNDVRGESGSGRGGTGRGVGPPPTQV
jgi:hypothetical protein